MPSEPSPAAVAAPKGFILVVDDEELIQRVARRAFERNGYGVLVAGDGDEALATYHKRRSDIVAVVADVTMNKLGGLELLQAIRRTSDVPVLVISGYEIDEMALASSASSVAYLMKPFNVHELLEAVQSLGVS